MKELEGFGEKSMGEDSSVDLRGSYVQIYYVCMYVRVYDFFRLRFRAQFLLDFFETWQDGCFYRELVLYSFWINSTQ